MLYCGGPDQWAPKNHMDDLKMDMTPARGTLVTKNNITLEYKDDLVHSFIVYPHMVDPVVNFICKAISQTCNQCRHEKQCTINHMALPISKL